MNFTTEQFEYSAIPGVGVRVDYNLTPRDAIEGVFFNIKASAAFAVTAPTALGGVSQVDQLTFLVPGSLADGEYIVITDGNGDEWAAAVDLTGASAAPSGLIWGAIPGGQKIQVDISAAVTAADVAAAFETALNTLVGFNAVVTTDDTAADGTMLLTQVIRGVVPITVSYLEDDSAAGNIVAANTVAGVASAVNVTNDTITFSTDPGWLTGKPVTLTFSGAAPTPLVNGTLYYAIRTAAGVYQFATSEANALAGTEINITDQGDEGSTITGTASGPVVAYLLNSLHKLSDTEIQTGVTTNYAYSVNDASAIKPLIAELGFDFSTYPLNSVFVKPSEVIGAFTLPSELKPHLTILIAYPELKLDDVYITRRGVV